ncbi:MAG: cytidylate kinase [Woeseiaceae bacterium]|nr:cytidylate kinase [Woeseiaceae bacterium]
MINKNTIPIITIDGPSGSGKGTISRKLASILSWNILDSGAIYRAVAFFVMENNLQLSDELNIRRLIKKTTIKFKLDSSYKQKILINRIDASEGIRTEECGTNASVIAKYEGIRKDMIALQRNFLKKPGLIADGRDMGTVVFPDSKIKVFLTADINVRAKRRYKELKEKGINVSLTAILRDMETRDKQDRERKHGPLAMTHDSIIVDSTNKSIDIVVSEILNYHEKIY